MKLRIDLPVEVLTMAANCASSEYLHLKCSGEEGNPLEFTVRRGLDMITLECTGAKCDASSLYCQIKTVNSIYKSKEQEFRANLSQLDNRNRLPDHDYSTVDVQQFTTPSSTVTNNTFQIGRRDLLSGKTRGKMSSASGRVDNIPDSLMTSYADEFESDSDSDSSNVDIEYDSDMETDSRNFARGRGKFSSSKEEFPNIKQKHRRKKTSGGKIASASFTVPSTKDKVSRKRKSLACKSDGDGYSECEMCNFKGTRQSILPHIAANHKEDSKFIQCYIDTLRELRKISDATANDPGREKCPCCESDHSNLTSLRKHLLYRCKKNPQKETLYGCIKCGYATVHKEAYDAHVLNHPMFECEHCLQIFDTRNELRSHKAKTHKITVCKTNYTCQYCKKEYNAKAKWERHEATHTGSVPSKFICDLCGKRFKDKNTAIQHKNTIHFKKYKYHCEKCGHGVTRPCHLKIHKCDKVRKAQDAPTQNNVE